MTNPSGLAPQAVGEPRSSENVREIWGRYLVAPKKKEVSKIPPKVVDSDFFDFSCTGVPVHGVTIDNYMSVPTAVARRVEDSPAAVPSSRYVGVS